MHDAFAWCLRSHRSKSAGFAKNSSQSSDFGSIENDRTRHHDEHPQCKCGVTTTLARTSYRRLMAKLVFGMSQSLDGYVDDAAGTLCMPPPGPAVFRHFVDVVAGHAG